MLYKCYTHVTKVLYKFYTACFYCVRIDISGIAANAHRHLWACEADPKTNKNKMKLLLLLIQHPPMKH